MNKLAQETSPYLLQHAHNPVDWYPWGDEAFTRARAEDKPILLSIGYAACHWCHVMAHESFEDEAIAALINAEFVAIKVDREERPDLDAIYMQAVQAMTGSGGWPMTVFLTPDGVPFYGGTYFPPEDRHGLPGFSRVLHGVAQAYRTRRDELSRSKEQLLGYLRQAMAIAPPRDTPLSPALLDQAAGNVIKQFDAQNGGFGNAPKFPQPMVLDFLLRRFARHRDERLGNVIRRTLDRMARGGIYDQIGGGFHRYAVDARWLVPHFEKMLYDNALLSRLYLHAAQALNEPFYRRVAVETLDYVQRDMTSPEGGFYATEDADSEGEEGRFYLWTREEIEHLLGAQDAAIVNSYYGVSDGTNFAGRNILYVPRDLDVVAHLAEVSEEQAWTAVQRGRLILREARAKRVRPARDEKVLAAWNGWMLRSMAEAARILGRDDYLRIAISNGAFLLERLHRDGRLWRSYREGVCKINGYLEDYAGVALGYLALWEATFDARWFAAARQLAESILAHFLDPSGAGFYDTGDDHETLIVRPKDVQDNATPSGNALAVELLLRLAAYTGEPTYERVATATLRAMAEMMTQYPLGFGHWLGAAAFHLAPPQEIAIIGDPSAEDTRALLAVVNGAYLPNAVLAVGLPGSDAAAQVPLLADRPQRDGRATAYVCRDFACQAPISEPAELAGQLGVALS